MPLQPIDTTSQQPNGKIGDPAKTAFEKVNANDQFLLDEIATKAASGDIAGAVAAEAALRVAADSEEALARTNADAALQGQFVGRNRFINGDLRFWQRRTSGRVGTGTGSIGSEQFFADRFTNSALDCSHDVSRIVISSGISFMQCTVAGAGSSSAAWHGQRIEGVSSLQGEVTLQVKLSGTAGKKVGVRVIQNFGTGGSPSDVVTTTVGVWTVAAAQELKTFTFTLPSTAGKTLGTNGNDYIYVVFDFCGTSYGGVMVGQNGSYTLSEYQIETGNKATQFEYRHPALERALCQRYYEKSYDANVAPGTATVFGRISTGSAGVTGVLNFAPVRTVPKRASPAVTLYAAGDTAVAGTVAQDQGAAVSASASSIGWNGFTVSWSNTSGRWGAFFHYTADAEL